jgi:uncharacterized protein (TIGR00725 family)
MKIKIGVMGSATEQLTKNQKDKAVALGRAIGKHDCILVTGGCPGLPHLTAKGVKQVGGLSIGISPGLSLSEHVQKYDSPTKHFDVLIFTGSGLMGREVVNIRSSDIVIILGGRSGTLGEFAIAYDEGKLIGVLQGTGGISDQIEVILDICKIKETGAKVILDTDPERLVEKVIKFFHEHFYPRTSIFDNIESSAFRGKK